jgi:hypothetical protein
MMTMMMVVLMMDLMVGRGCWMTWSDGWMVVMVLRVQ